VDALGRPIATVVRNGPNPQTDWYTTRSTYDIQGNLLTFIDELGRLASTHVYDLANRLLRSEQLDAGMQRVIPDVLGNPLEERDSKGALVLQAYDVMQRPIRRWARDGADEPLTLRERIIYGDAAEAGLTPAQATAANLLGQVYKHYDEAGLLSAETYDFKGNLLEKVRQVVSDASILSVFGPAPANDWRVHAFRVDWQPPSGATLTQHASALLEPTMYRTSVRYDALQRVKTMYYPEDVEGRRRVLRPLYNRAGALERMELDGTPFVVQIAYNAMGQRTLVAYGNGVMTRHAYDTQTFRPVRARTERYTQPAALTYHPTGTPLQDCAYSHDLVGNITAIRDRTPASGVPNTLLGVDALDRAFTYDPLYRLLSATGRECDTPPPPPPWDDAPRCADLSRTRGYTERYDYDPAGNMTRLQHQAVSGGFTRTFALALGGNRLATVTIGETTYDYAYDANGNLLREHASRHFEWDHADRMRVHRTQAATAEPSTHAHYLYDAGGERVKKLVRKQGGQVEVTVYVDGSFEHHRLVQGGTTQENNTLHVMDDHSRIALVRVGSPFPGDTAPALQYHLGGHLDSSNMVVDASGTLINREEFTPYGETSFGSFAEKRYRYTGKERDGESGLYYHGARYYAPWLAKWISCDPLGTVDGSNLYTYGKNNPINFQDPTGTQSKPKDGTGSATLTLPDPEDAEVWRDPETNELFYDFDPDDTPKPAGGNGQGGEEKPRSKKTKSEHSTLDDLVTIAGFVNLEKIHEESPEGKTGGIPGGKGSSSSRIGQALYVGLTALSMVGGLIAKGIGKAFKAVKGAVGKVINKIRHLFRGDAPSVAHLELSAGEGVNRLRKMLFPGAKPRSGATAVQRRVQLATTAKGGTVVSFDSPITLADTAKYIDQVVLANPGRFPGPIFVYAGVHGSKKGGRIVGEAAGVYKAARELLQSKGIKVIDAKYISERMVGNLMDKATGTHIITWCWSGRCVAP
jgi:RHS repeat-associated protein